jgi:hypothetical protein
MQISLHCDLCGERGLYDLAELNIGYIVSVPCKRCSLPITLPTENLNLGEKLERQQAPTFPVLKEGDVVRIDNKDHVWHNQIAIIRGQNHRFYRIELNGGKVWVPKEWVKLHEPSEPDEGDW